LISTCKIFVRFDTWNKGASTDHSHWEHLQVACKLDLVRLQEVRWEKGGAQPDSKGLQFSVEKVIK
jgi:hypothetical protein